jgi:rhodanese-related sulfurtransferase
MDEIPEITPRELADKLRGPNPPVLVDVRLPWEYQLVAIPNSRLVPLQELPAHADELEDLAGKKVVVICHHGVRSLSGAAFLRQLGADAKSLAGGIDAYSAEVDATLPRY